MSDKIKLEDTTYFHIGTSSAASGAATNADSTPTAAVEEDGSAMGYAPSVANVATGLYRVTVVASAANGFEAGKRYSVYITATVGGVTGRDGVHEFEVVARDLDDVAFPNVSGRGMDVDASGGVEITPDQSVNVNKWLAATPNSLNNGLVQSDVERWANVVVNGLISGRVDASVGALAAAVITAAAIAAGAISSGKIGAGAITATEAPNLDAAVSGRASAAQATAIQADTDDIQTRLPAALVAGRMSSQVGAMAAGVIDAAAIGTGAIDADALAADTIQAAKIQTGAITSAKFAAGAITSTVAPNLDAAVSSRAPESGGNVAAIKAKTDNLPLDPADESILEAVIATRAAPGAAMTLTRAEEIAVANAIATRVFEGSLTLEHMMRIILAVSVLKSNGMEVNAPNFRDLADAKNRVTATVDVNGNRLTVALDGT